MKREKCIIYLQDTPLVESNRWIATIDVESKQFSDGEHYDRILISEKNLSDIDLIIYGSTHDESSFMRMYDLAYTAASMGVHSITLVIPYFGYSTMERAVYAGEVVKAKTRAAVLSSLPSGAVANKVVLFDLHSEGIPYYFDGNMHVRHVYGKPLIRKMIDEISRKENVKFEDLVIGSTDAGRGKWVESLAKDFGTDCAIAIKRRVADGETQHTGINAAVDGKIVLLYDDMIRSGSSICAAASAYFDCGAKKIFVLATHAPFTSLGSHPVIERLRAANVSGIFVTNSHPRAGDITKAFGFYNVYDCSALLLSSSLLSATK